MGKNNLQPKDIGIKIVDRRRTDYTYTGDDSQFNIQSSLNDEKNNDTSKKSKTERDVERLRHDVAKNSKIRNKGRITGGQSKQGHSSVYE